jgi:hypothetical protein
MTSPMDFGFFLLLNAVLFLRLEDLVPEIAGLRLYLVAIVFATFASLPKLLVLLSWDELRKRSVLFCVLGVLFAGTLSLVVQGRLDAAFDFAGEFAKVVLYLGILLAVVDSPGRFRFFVASLVVLTVALTTVGLGQFHGMWDFPGLDPVMQRETDRETGEAVWIPRLVCAGMFNDPNDLCLALVFGMLCCFYLFVSAENLAAKPFYLLPVPYLFYAMLETHSRGGLLGFMAGGAGWLYARYGLRWMGPMVAVAVPALLAVLGGRIASIGGGGTAHERLMLWADGLSDLLGRPLYIPTGMGVGYYVEEHGLVAHNSYVNAYVEMGLLGGGFFVIAFLDSLRQTNATRDIEGLSPLAVTTRCFVFAAVFGYAAGAYSVSRNFVVPTYLVLGLAAAYNSQMYPEMPERYCVNDAWVMRAALVSVGGLVFLKYFTQFAGMAGV